MLIKYGLKIYKIWFTHEGTVQLNCKLYQGDLDHVIKGDVTN